METKIIEAYGLSCGFHEKSSEWMWMSTAQMKKETKNSCNIVNLIFKSNASECELKTIPKFETNNFLGLII